MTFDEFVARFNNKATDFDGVASVQCVDLAKMYMYYVCNVKMGSIGNAEAYYNKYHELAILHDNFELIPNTPSYIPQKRRYSYMGKTT